MIAPGPRLTSRRVVLDTNVLLSGIFFGGGPGRVLTAWQNSRFELVISPAILAEYRDARAILASRYASIETALVAILSLVAQTATVVDAPELPERVSADPADDKFLGMCDGSLCANDRLGRQTPPAFERLERVADSHATSVRRSSQGMV